MNYPRDFSTTYARLKEELAQGPDAPFADVLVVCGQGVYEDGRYYGEYHDRDVYFEHGMGIPDLVAKWKYNCIVLSGGFTQDKAPWTSEAESFLRMLSDSGMSLPCDVPLLLEECALDSSENLLFGLMRARLALASRRIRRVGIWSAWKFKKWRFNRNAQALGIVERTYFHGLAPASATNVQVLPEDAAQKTSAEYKEDVLEFSLLRTEAMEQKRARRWRNNRSDPKRDEALEDVFGEGSKDPSKWHLSQDGNSPEMKFGDKTCSLYRNRLSPFTSKFPKTMDALRALTPGATDARLGQAFAEEVMFVEPNQPMQPTGSAGR